MKELIINGQAVKSIWKTGSNETPKNEKPIKCRQPYRDPTADAAINNIMREERRKHKDKKRNEKKLKAKQTPRSN